MQFTVLKSFRAKASLGLAIGATAVLLIACGGGGGAGMAASSQSLNSSGVITAFGSVFVNGHEFNTGSTNFVDDDTGAIVRTAAGLEVGMLAEVASGDSSSATEIHTHSLVRGYVDGLNIPGGLITVMGQAASVDTNTQISDRRACAIASPATCTAITGLSGLSVTTVSGGTTTPGTYVALDGYLFNAGSGATNMIATLVSVRDLPTTAPQTNATFKAEGVLTISGSVYTIGGLTLGLSSTTCKVGTTVTPCATAFSTGQVVSAISSVAPPVLPATNFAPITARLVKRLGIASSGQTVEVEGRVSSVSGSVIVVRGISITLPSGTAAPSVGDLVEVVGTLDSTGQNITATSLEIERSASLEDAPTTLSLGLLGQVSQVAAGTSANTYTLSLLGQTIAVNAQTRLMDRSIRNWADFDPSNNPGTAHPFNIQTFQSYLAASTSQTVRANVQSDGAGHLVALSFTIIQTSNTSYVAGIVDTGSVTGGPPVTFTVGGIHISALPSVIVDRHNNVVTLNPGDVIRAQGSFAAGVLTATQVMDGGAFQSGHERHGGEF